MFKFNLINVTAVLLMASYLAVFSAYAAGDDAAVVTGKLYCITSSGEMVYKAGVCPVEHLGHIMLTDKGKALMISHGGGELLRKMNVPPGASVEVIGRIIKEELKSLEIKEIRILEGVGGGS